MKLSKYFISMLFFLTAINAQTISFNEDSTAAAVEYNRIYFPLLNQGVLAQTDFGSSINSVMKYDNKSVIFSGGFFLSGYANTTLWANGVARSFLIQDYLPGKVGSDENSSENKIYVVKASDTPFGEEWQDWEKAIEQGAYFYDGDNDGVYNPVDKNNNGQWDADEDKPDILYDASLFTVYNDGVPSESRRWSSVEQLGLEIRQTVFVSNRNTILNDVVFVRYSIVYKGLDNPSEPDSLTDVIFGIWSDSDIGEVSSAAADDLSGCDTLLQSGYTYNDSSDPDFGNNPPAIFRTIVQGPLVKTNKPSDIGFNRMGPDLGEESFGGYTNLTMNSYIHIIGDVPINDPNTAVEARNYMLGLTSNGERLDPCDWILGEVRDDVDCSNVNPLLWYSGDPVTDYGWINNSPQDQRDLTSSHKFTLHKNEPMDIIIAYTVGRGMDHLNSITVARETVQYIHEEYERNFSTIVGVEEDKKEELPSSFTLYQNYPNPFNPTTKIKFTIGTPPVSSPLQKGRTKEGFVTLKVFDILGREIKTLLSKPMQPGSYEIEFDGSDLPSGVYFYRLNAGKFSESRKMILLR